MSRGRYFVIAAAAAALFACHEEPQGLSSMAQSPLVRLIPSQVQVASVPGDLSPLFDRDTTTRSPVGAPVLVQLAFPHDVRVETVRMFAPRGVSLAGLSAEEPSPDAWETWRVAAPASGSSILLRLDPTAADAGLGELEVWGRGLPDRVRDLELLATLSRAGANPPFENAAVAAADNQSVTLTPVGLNEGSACGTFTVASAVSPRNARRAALAYETAGVQRGAVLRRSVNAHPASGGLWLGGGTVEHSVYDELNPEELTGKDTFQLCLPDDATQAVTVNNPRLLLELDDGTDVLDRESAAALGNAFDGRLDTAQAFPAGRLQASLARPLSIWSARLRLENPAASAQVSIEGSDGAWSSATPASLVRGWNALPAMPGLPLDAIAVDFASAAGALAAAGDVPAASISELEIAGSPVGARIAEPRLVITSPHLSYPASAPGRAVGERFGTRAWISGWAESPAGPGEVELDGAPAGIGSFSVPLNRAELLGNPAGSWKVTLTARFPDGATLSREVYLDDDQGPSLTSEGQPGGSEESSSQRFGKENQTAWGRIGARGGHLALGKDVAFDAPPGALKSDVSIGIRHEMPESVPPLDPGMLNVSAPVGAGYRFLPAGQQFSAAVKVTLPYDASLLPEGVPPEAIRTFFYDGKAQRWQSLPLAQVLRATSQVVSETTHFTFMVNAVLVPPEHPGPASFNPNSIKGLKAADPAANIDFISPPGANSQGTGRLSMPIRLPPARGAFQPQLALVYDSSGPNGFAGVGWDLPMSKVAVDTRFGVPYYDGTERYALDGEELVALDIATCLDGSHGTLYGARVERSFRRILRCGASNAAYRFEVTDKQGTLYLYGLTDGARLASYATGDAAEWYLERVVDANGNLTLFSYQPDQRVEDGTAFDLNNSEDFRQLYPAHIYYTGQLGRDSRALGELAANAGVGAYAVDFGFASFGEAGGEAALDRPDVLISAREGFKTVTRRALGSIRVSLTAGPNAGVIREYKLSYQTGDFGKQRLGAVDVYGEGGAASGKVFYRHAFTWSRVPSQGFNPSIGVWEDPSGGTDPLTGSFETSGTLHGYVGIGLGLKRSDGSVGVGVDWSNHTADTTSTLLDVNGDGLPDKVFPSHVLFNDNGAEPGMKPQPPKGDPAFGLDDGVGIAFGVGSDSSFPSLGAETGSALSAGLQLVLPLGPVSISAKVGGTLNWNNSDAFFIDADGDGLPDLLWEGQVYFNQRRCGDASCTCPAGQLCFSPLKQVATGLIPSSFARLMPRTGGGIDLGDGADLGDATQPARNAAAASITPNSPFIEWEAPYAGVVDVTGHLQYARSFVPRAGQDGVRLSVYRHRPSSSSPDTTLLDPFDYPADATSPLDLSHAGVEVHAQDRLYFVLSTKDDFPLGQSDAGVPIPLEEVELAPVIQYASCSGDCGSISSADNGAVDGTGAPLFKFDRAADFALSGDPLMGIVSPVSGTLHLSGPLAKQLTSDDVRVCIQHFQPSDLLPNVPCASSGATFSKGDGGTVTRENEYFAVLPSNQATTQELSLDVQLDRGDTLVFRVDSDLAINPSAVQWAPAAQVSELCLPGDGGCRQPLDDELKRFSFAATPHLEEHRQATAIPLRSLVVPQSGTLVLRSSNQDLSASPAVTFSARTPAQLIFKHGVNQSAGLDGGLQIPVTAGQRILFEAHSDTPRGYAWNLSARLFLPDGGPGGSDGGTAGIALSVPMNTSYDRYIESDSGAPSNFRTMPMSGGHHGWRYGVWHGGADGGEAFDPSLLYAKGTAISIPEGSSEEQLTAMKGQFRDPNNRLARASQLFSPMAPSRTGTRQGLPSQGGSPGLLPDVPAFISQDRTVFVTGFAMHASQSGTDVDTGRSLRTLFVLKNAHRASTGWTLSGGLGLGLQTPAGSGDVSGDLGLGSSSQVADVRDMNGDGIVDVVSKDHGVVLSPVAGQGGATHQFGEGLQLSERSELSISLGLGYGIPIKTETIFGKTLGFQALYPSDGMGGAVNLSSTKVELMDINGDGLPDQVRVGSAPGVMLVRLNLGTSFAAKEDSVPIPDLAAPPSPDGGTLVHDLSEQLKMRSGNPPDDPDLQGAIDGGMQIAAALESPDALEKSTAFTLTRNMGVQFDEMFGISANVESSMSQTEASLVDVTGDGLPDYVQKISGEKFFRVRINTGYGFGPEIHWTAPAFPVGSLSGFGLPYDANMQGVYNLLQKAGLTGGSDEVSASGVLSGASIGFVASAPPWPIFGVSLLLSGGANVSYRYSGFEMGFVDIDGDGLADQVLRRQQFNPITNTSTSLPVYARLNQEKNGNLLLHVAEPLGESFDLAYERIGNTTDMPQSRHVLASVDVHDGVGQGSGHDLHSQYQYGNGFYDREEREFFGFGTITTTRPDGAKEIAEYENRDYARRGLVKKESLEDADGNLFTVSTNSYGPPQHVTGPLAGSGSQTAQEQDCVANTPFFLDPQAFCSSVFVPLQSTEVSQYEGQGKATDGIAPITTRQELTYDGFGNVLAFVDYGDTAVADDEINATIVYAGDTAASALYSVSRPKHVTVQQGRLVGSGAVLREREASYEDHGNLNTFGAHVDGRVATSILTWNPNGMLESFTGPPTDKGPGYSVAYSYNDDVTGSYVTGIVDSFGLSSSATYDDRYGVATRTVDENGNAQSMSYDEFGRLKAVTSPLDTAGGAPTLSMQYSWPESIQRPAFATTHHKMPAGFSPSTAQTLDTVVFVDGLRRAMQTKESAQVQPGDEPAQTVQGFAVSGKLTFDAMGRVASRGQLFFDQGGETALATELPEQQYATTFAYDVLGRTLQTISPDATAVGDGLTDTATVSYGFGKPRGEGPQRFSSTVTDPMGNTQASYQDAEGRTVAVEEHLVEVTDGGVVQRALTTQYDYDVLGQLVAIHDAAAPSNTTSMTYDDLGRRKTLTNPDTGTTWFEYDLAGNLTRKVDANLAEAKREIKYLYEQNRLTDVVHPSSPSIHFDYGGASAKENGAGRVVRVTDESGTEERGYDALGDLVRTRREVKPLRPGDGAQAFETRFTFDSFGRMLTLTYPDGELLQYQYGGGGLLTSAQGIRNGSAFPHGAETYLAALNYDVFGQRVYEVLGNGVSTKYSYSPDTRRLSHLETTTQAPAKRTLQQLSYSYDRAGNVVAVQNLLVPATDAHSGTVSYQHTYDSLYRLTHTTASALARPGVTDRFESSFAYSDIHNMSRNTQVRELVDALNPGGGVQRPAGSNHDWSYSYKGGGPHQVSQIGPVVFRYDANGNTVLECRAGQGQCPQAEAGSEAPPPVDQTDGLPDYRTFQWTEENWLRSVTDAQGQRTTRFFYDASGQRVAKLGEGGVELSIGQFYSVVHGQFASKHVFAGPARVATKVVPVRGNQGIGLTGGADVPSLPPGCEESGFVPSKCPPVLALGNAAYLGTGSVKPATYYYHPDHLGSTEWMTDQTGRVHEHLEYFPYGDVWRDSKGDADPPNPTSRTPNYLFTGKEFDPETGLTYFGARYYDAKLARWPNPDPSFLDQGPRGFNVYHYAAWNPIRATDPDGRSPDWTPQWTVESQQQAYNFAISDAGKRTLEFELGVLAAPVIGLGCTGAPQVCAALGWPTLAGTMTSSQPTLVNIGNVIQHPEMHLFQIGLVLGGVGPAFESLFEALVAPRLPRLSLGVGDEVSSPAPSAASGCPFCHLTDAEIDAAVNAPATSGPMIQAPAPTGARFNISGGMMVNEHTVQATSSAPGAKGNAATRIRVHTPDPSAPPGSNSATGNTAMILQRSGARRLVPGQGWIRTETATDAEMNASHVPIHR